MGFVAVVLVVVLVDGWGWGLVMKTLDGREGG